MEDILLKNLPLIPSNPIELLYLNNSNALKLSPAPPFFRGEIQARFFCQVYCIYPGELVVQRYTHPGQEIDKGSIVVGFECGPGSCLEPSPQLVEDGDKVPAVDVHPRATKSITDKPRKKTLENVAPDSINRVPY
jgi:hypothetical protein